jgi:hypothetical protein
MLRRPGISSKLNSAANRGNLKTHGADVAISFLAKHLMRGLALFALTSLIFPQDAHAYLDPGSASYIFQIIVAALLGALFFFKSFFRRIINFFKKPPKEGPQ